MTMNKEFTSEEILDDLYEARTLLNSAAYKIDKNYENKYTDHTSKLYETCQVIDQLNKIVEGPTLDEVSSSLKSFYKLTEEIVEDIDDRMNSSLAGEYGKQEEAVEYTSSRLTEARQAILTIQDNLHTINGLYYELYPEIFFEDLEEGEEDNASNH